MFRILNNAVVISFSGRKEVEKYYYSNLCDSKCEQILEEFGSLFFLSRTKQYEQNSGWNSHYEWNSCGSWLQLFSSLPFFFSYEDQQSSAIEPYKNSSKLTFCYTSMQSPKTTQKHTLLASEPVFSLGSHYSQSYVRKTFFFNQTKTQPRYASLAADSIH